MEREISFNQIQCPKCGSYEILIDSGKSSFSWLLLLGIEFALWPLTIIFGFGWLSGGTTRRMFESFLKGEAFAFCRICYYKFTVDEVPDEPIKPDYEFIRRVKERRGI